MTDRYADPEGAYELRPPPGWVTEPAGDEDGVELSAPDGFGVLHLLAFERDPDDFADPAEEMYAFLEAQDVVLQEDEIEDVELEDGGELALSEYASTDEETGEETFWLVGVATAPGRLVFATYVCTAGDEREELPAVREALRSLRLREPQ